jgi:hypothetical protein
MGITNTTGMIVAAILGGLAGALILVFAYFVGIALAGAGLGALLAHLIARQVTAADPSALAVIGASVAGAIVAMLLQRYVIVVATAFGGAWTIIVGGLAAAAGRLAPQFASDADVWILYPLNPAPGLTWLPYAWAALGLVGTIVQLGVTAKRR